MRNVCEGGGIGVSPIYSLSTSSRAILVILVTSQTIFWLPLMFLINPCWKNGTFPVRQQEKCNIPSQNVGTVAFSFISFDGDSGSIGRPCLNLCFRTRVACSKSFRIKLIAQFPLKRPLFKVLSDFDAKSRFFIFGSIQSDGDSGSIGRPYLYICFRTRIVCSKSFEIKLIAQFPLKRPLFKIWSSNTSPLRNLSHLPPSYTNWFRRYPLIFLENQRLQAPRKGFDDR